MPFPKCAIIWAEGSNMWNCRACSLPCRGADAERGAEGQSLGTSWTVACATCNAENSTSPWNTEPKKSTWSYFILSKTSRGAGLAQSVEPPTRSQGRVFEPHVVCRTSFKLKKEYLSKTNNCSSSLTTTQQQQIHKKSRSFHCGKGEWNVQRGNLFSCVVGPGHLPNVVGEARDVFAGHAVLKACCPEGISTSARSAFSPRMVYGDRWQLTNLASCEGES